MPRKPHKYHYIYKTTNLLSGKYYWGMHSTSNLNDGYMGSGKRLTYSIRKHGRTNHKVEIIEFLNSREELGKRESEIINLNEIAKEDCMNLRVGGLGGERSEYKPPWNKGHKSVTKLNLSPEQREKRSEYQNKIWEGRKHSNESKEKMRESHLGQIPWMKNKTHSEETKQKISNTKKERGINPSFGMKGKTHSEETKKKMKESRKGEGNSFYGRKHSPETLRKIQETRKKNRELNKSQI